MARPIACVFALLAAECDYHSYCYDATGRLLCSTGAPAGGLNVVLNGSSPWEHARPQGPADFDRHISYDYAQRMKTETDSGGRFHARFVAAGLYSTLGTPPPAPGLSEVYIWANYHGQWWPITVAIDHRMQQRTYPGGRHVELPDISLPVSETQADTQPTTRTVDIYEYVVEPATRPATRPASSRPSILLRDQ